MSPVWVVMPSKRPPAEANRVLAKWKERGYRIGLFCDSAQDAREKISDLRITTFPYEGYAKAANLLISAALADPAVKWVGVAADDVEPDLNHTAEEIARECSEHFRQQAILKALSSDKEFAKGCPEPARVDTFGVMQPTGDRWGDRNGAYIDRVAGSPWIGREFAERVYRGNGPYWPEYGHMGVDEELREVAIKLGVYWERPDLTHFHAHWGRPRPGETMGQSARMPEFLAEANSPEHWKRYKAIFNARKAAGFPGHEPV